MVKETWKQDLDIIEKLLKPEWIEKSKNIRIKQIQLAEKANDGNNRFSK